VDLKEVPEVGVSAHRLMKVYQKWPFVKTRKDVLALRDFSATIPEGEIFCVLGHNGAGKTTTVSMMTGLFEPTFGDASIYGHSIVTEMDKIRHIMGVCPQVPFYVLLLFIIYCLFILIVGTIVLNCIKLGGGSTIFCGMS
jgi:ABC-type multidrug transport system ATPase subunit